MTQQELFDSKKRYRVCLGCRRKFPEEEFITEKTAKDGLGAFCMDCLKKSNTLRKPPVDPIVKSKKHWTKI
jgi:hypothetical protein